MAEIATKVAYGTTTTMTITLASLASSTSGVGRQSTLVDNTTTRFERARVSLKIKLGTSPTGGNIYIYVIRSRDGSAIESGAGASDAGWTATPYDMPIATLPIGSLGTGGVVNKSIMIHNPGPHWAIAIAHDTGVSLDSTGGNHEAVFRGENPVAVL